MESNGTNQTNESNEAATEAAQHVVDEVTSYEYSGDKERIADQLDAGLSESGVDVDDAQKQQLVDQIDDLKGDEDAGTPKVSDAEPS